MPSDILYEIGRDNSESVTFSQNGLQEGVEPFRPGHGFFQLLEKGGECSHIVK
jgi:hypothetical protein